LSNTDTEESFQQRIRRIERYIAQRDRGELMRLAKAGIDRKIALRLLALAPREFGSWALEEMRQNQVALRSISGRLTTMARDTKKIADSRFMGLPFWAFLFEGWTGPAPEDLNQLPDHYTMFPRVERMKWPPQTLVEDDPGIPLVLAGMDVLAKRFRNEANRLGRFLRAFGRTDTGVVALLAKCWFLRVKAPDGLRLSRKGNRARLSMDYLEELATLLTFAFEATEKPKVFSADSLRMTFKRHARRVIVQMLTLSEPPSKTEASPHFAPPLSLGQVSLERDS